MSRATKTITERDVPSADKKALDGAEELAHVVGANLRRLRTRRGHSLERLSQQSGVSRAMLGQIETGKSVPTIGLLWKVASALGVPFSTLMASNEDSGTRVLLHQKSKVLESSEGRFKSRALFPYDEARRVEFYELRIEPGHSEDAEAHLGGTFENLVVNQGDVEILIEGEPAYQLGEGDAIVFRADVAHAYRNTGERPALLYLVMTYSETVGG